MEHLLYRLYGVDAPCISYFLTSILAAFCSVCKVNYEHMENWNDTAEWDLHRGRSGKQFYKVELFVVLDFAMYKQ